MGEGRRMIQLKEVMITLIEKRGGQETHLDLHFHCLKHLHLFVVSNWRASTSVPSQSDTNPADESVDVAEEGGVIH